MEEALRFFRAAEVWVYLILGLGGLIYIRKFADAWRELRIATFGLEKESAQNRLNQSASMLVLLLTMAVTEFILVSFIAPSIPNAIPLPTSTVDLVTTDEALTPQTNENGNVTEVPTPILAFESACLPGQVEITSPQNGEEVGGIVEVIGSASIPNFGFYKFEIKRPEDSVWLTIQAGNAPIQNSTLGDWDTTQLIPGVYQLGLVVVDNQAQATDPCVVQIRVLAPPDE
jgi:hypothetical protein